MRKKRYLVLLLPILLATILATSGWSQSFNATISGLVTDPSGAVVPEAELTLTEISTGAVTKLATGSDGLFRFPNLPRGSYELKVSAKGFRDFLQRGINVSINESVRVGIKLEVGAFAGNAGYGNNDFNTDIASPSFGTWNGVASSPRNIQVGARIEF